MKDYSYWTVLGDTPK